MTTVELFTCSKKTCIAETTQTARVNSVTHKGAAVTWAVLSVLSCSLFEDIQWLISRTQRSSWWTDDAIQLQQKWRYQERLSPRGHGAFDQDGRMGPPIFDYTAP